VRNTQPLSNPFGTSVCCNGEAFTIAWKFNAGSPHSYAFTYVYGIDATVNTSVSTYVSSYYNSVKTVIYSDGQYDHICMTGFDANNRCTWESEVIPRAKFNAGACGDITINRIPATNTYFVTAWFGMYTTFVYYNLYAPTFTVDNIIPLVKDKYNGMNMVYFIIASDGKPISYTTPADPAVSLSSTSNTLSWVTVPGATSYTLLIFTGIPLVAVGTNVNMIYTQTSYVMTSLTAGVSYTALLFASNNAGPSLAADIPRTTTAMAGSAACVTFIAK
jgi:hypothetical protein